nr:PREDICTED: uncharacterized protein LOC109032938 [Bemisia tabaci]
MKRTFPTVETTTRILITILTAAPSASLDPSKFTFYKMPYPLSAPCDLCEGPDGTLWGDDFAGPFIFRVDPNTSLVEHYQIPYTIPALNITLPPEVGQIIGRTALACAIRPGADGNIYAATGTRNQLARINPKTRKIEIVVSLSVLGNLQPFNDLYTSPTGMWFTMTTGNLIGFYCYNTSRVTFYRVPTPLAIPLGIYYASDGYVYFCELLGNKMGRLDPRTGVIKEYIIPLGGQGPAVVRAETPPPAGKKHPYIWFTCSLGNSVGRLDPNTETGKIKLYSNPLVGGIPSENTVDSKGNVWFTTTLQNTLCKIDRNGTVSYVQIPGTVLLAPISSPLYFVFAVNYGPGNALWFDLLLGGRVGRYSLAE